MFEDVPPKPKKKLEAARDGTGPPPNKTALGQGDEPDEDPHVRQRPTIRHILMGYVLLAKAFWLAILGRSQDPQE